MKRGKEEEEEEEKEKARRYIRDAIAVHLPGME